MRKLMTVVILALAVLGGQFNKVEAADAKPTIGIIQYVEHAALDDAREGFLAALADQGLVADENVAIDYQNAQGDAANLSTIGDRLIAKGVDLILAIATPAAQSVAAKTTEIPILGTAITDYVAARLVNSAEAPGTNVSGTTDMNPIEEQIDLLKTLVPHAETVGLLYTSSEDNSVLQARLARAAIEALGLRHVEITISNSNEVQQAVQALVKRVDAIYVPTDNIISSSMPIVYGVTAEAKLPVICGEANQVINGGLATIGINYYDLGYQTGLMAVEVLNGKDVAAMPIEASKNFDYAINGPVAREIGLAIPAKLQKYVIEEGLNP